MRNLNFKDADFSIETTDLTLADFLLVRDKTDWEHRTIKTNNYTTQLRRLTAWYGKSYSYSGIVNTPKPIPEHLLPLFDLVKDKCNIEFNSVLLNRYRSGEDSIGWHSDNEYGLGPNTYIASLSLGQSRSFLLRHNTENLEYKVELNHGDLLLMGNNSQIKYQHSVPKEKLCKGERINLTFRIIN